MVRTWERYQNDAYDARNKKVCNTSNSSHPNYDLLPSLMWWVTFSLLFVLLSLVFVGHSPCRFASNRECEIVSMPWVQQLNCTHLPHQSVLHIPEIDTDSPYSGVVFIHIRMWTTNWCGWKCCTISSLPGIQCCMYFYCIACKLGPEDTSIVFYKAIMIILNCTSKNLPDRAWWLCTILLPV
jgi:hypothetical protein